MNMVPVLGVYFRFYEICIKIMVQESISEILLIVCPLKFNIYFIIFTACILWIINEYATK